METPDQYADDPGQHGKVACPYMRLNMKSWLCKCRNMGKKSPTARAAMARGSTPKHQLESLNTLTLQLLCSHHLPMNTECLSSKRWYEKKTKTYSTRDSLVVTDQTTSLAVMYRNKGFRKKQLWTQETGASNQ